MTPACDDIPLAPAIDHQVILELYDLLEDEADEVIRGFAQTCIREARTLHDDVGNHIRLQRLSQRLKNTAAHLGAQRLVAACRQLENSLRHADPAGPAGLDAMIAHIDTELRTAVTALQALLPGRAADASHTATTMQTRP